MRGLLVVPADYPARARPAPAGAARIPKSRPATTAQVPPLDASEELIAAVNQVMPFGKYAGRRLLELPEPYLVWFHREGFPPGRLGEQLALMYEIKLNGLEGMLRPLLRP